MCTKTGGILLEKTLFLLNLRFKFHTNVSNSRQDIRQTQCIMRSYPCTLSGLVHVLILMKFEGRPLRMRRYGGDLVKLLCPFCLSESPSGSFQGGDLKSSKPRNGSDSDIVLIFN